jgi:hypothetical protein
MNRNSLRNSGRTRARVALVRAVPVVATDPADPVALVDPVARLAATVEAQESAS